MPTPKMVEGLRDLIAIYESGPNAGTAGVVIQTIQTQGVMVEFVAHEDSTLSLIEDIVNFAMILMSLYQDTQAPNPVHAYGPAAKAILGAYWVG